MRKLSVLALVGLIWSGNEAFGAEPSNAYDALVFSGGNLTINGTTTISGGSVVTNGNVVHTGGILNVDSIYAGGTFSSSGAAFQNSTGDWLFGGSINNLGGPGSVFGGNVISGGDVNFLDSSEKIKGNVIAKGSVTLPFSFATIQGDLQVGNNVNIQGTVGGNVNYGGTFTKGTWGVVNGLVTKGGVVAPTPYTPIVSPSDTMKSGSGTPLNLANFETRSLTPGVYGKLNFASGNTVNLTAGDYVFDAISSNFSLNVLNFDISNGPINIFVVADFNFNFIESINGQEIFAVNKPNVNWANLVNIEVGHSFKTNTQIYGTVFAPFGNITVDTAGAVTGKLVAAGDVVLNSATVTAVPEPASLGLLGLGMVGLIRRKR